MSTINLTSGYMVSRAGSERVVNQLTRAEVESYITDHRDELDTYLGTWADPDTGLVYLDISDNLDDAISAGVERDQLAIYAVESGETINATGYGTGNTMRCGSEHRSSTGIAIGG